MAPASTWTGEARSPIVPGEDGPLLPRLRAARVATAPWPGDARPQPRSEERRKTGLPVPGKGGPSEAGSPPRRSRKRGRQRTPDPPRPTPARIKSCSAGGTPAGAGQTGDKAADCEGPEEAGGAGSRATRCSQGQEPTRPHCGGRGRSPAYPFLAVLLGARCLTSRGLSFLLYEAGLIGRVPGLL